MNTHHLQWLAMLALGLMSPASALAFDYPPPGDAVRGAQLWANNCARCHNIRSAPELRDDQWITTMFHMRVRAGLTGQETRDILSFMQDANNAVAEAELPDAPGGKETGAALSGREIYQQTCVACHGADGRGVVPGAPDLTRPDGRLSKSDSALMNSLLNGLRSPGSPMAMPARGGNPDLSDEDMKRVLRYLREAFAP